jgi:DNA-binding CsgD family transcriptional regulator
VTSTIEVAMRRVIDQIEAVNLDGRPLGVLPELRELLGFDAMIYARPVERTTGWSIDGFASDGLANPTRMRRALEEQMKCASTPVPWLDLRHPPEDQCNVPVDLESVIGSIRYRTSPLFRRVIDPTEVSSHRLVRMLICDGVTVAAWIGGFSPQPIARAKRDLMARIAGPLRERLRIERLLASAPRFHAALEVTLQHIGAPALIVDARGRVHEMNLAARELIATRRDDVFSSIAALRARRAPALPFTLTRVSTAGYSEQFLAVMRPRSIESRLSVSVTLAVNRWKLTPRQAEVLRMIVDGDSNTDIARRLAISHRAVEMHVTAIFGRAAVESRTQLVAAVLLA